jgi:hypothetical protein
VIVAAFAMIGMATGAHAQSKCTSAKLKAAGNFSSCELGADAKEAATGTFPKETCPSKYLQVFSKANEAGDCLAPTGDEIAIRDKVLAFRADVNTTIRDSNALPSKCIAMKTKAAGKKASCKLQVFANAASKGLPLDTPKLAKCSAKFSSASTKADGGSDCGSAAGDADTIEGKVDAFVTDANAELTAQRCGSPSTITSSFNGTAIAQPNSIWFSSVLKASGLPTNTTTVVDFTNVSIHFTADNVNFNLSMPNAQISFVPNGTVGTTFDIVTNTWQTTSQPALAGNTFLDGLGFQLPINFPGGINPVSWTGTFNSATSGITISWEWAAAVYTSFSFDNNSLGVKPADDNGPPYFNSDHAGTPENFKASEIGGARGEGGSNFTGTYGPTANMTCP